jgi:hypothetical protein
MRDYFLDISIIVIQMDGDDVILGIQWLKPLGTMAIIFHELFMRLISKGKEV